MMQEIITDPGNDWIAEAGLDPSLRELEAQVDPRCGAPRKDGTPCQNKLFGGRHCWRHKPEQEAQEVTEPAPERRVHKVQRRYTR
jgi:hypothetical protein